ncbi:type I-E CRISPR-associated protein Cas6/Cse3/CasE [Marinobacterium sp. BA1]|uniref:type I-E CRISPR-associated protein Cas6/Cse3/CasE n=1 Tax=Marinobacterium sp. BA1 TaxID=3138931 RepID=UPI0032E71D0C
MHYYQTTLLLPIAPGNLYTLHQGVDSLVRSTYLGEASASALRHEADAVPQYAYRAVARDYQSSIIMLRSRQPIGLTDERTREIQFNAGDVLRFQYFPCVTSKRDGRSILLDEAELPGKVIVPRLLKAGFEARSINIKGVDRLSCNKPKNSPFFLAGAHTEVEAQVVDPDAAMDAFVYGIGRKTVFGFGLMLNVEKE